MSNWHIHYTTDPQDLESRFSQEDGLAYLASILEELDEEAKGRLERVKNLMNMIPAIEADFVDLCYFKGWTQTRVAEMYRVKQPTVNYRLARAARRIRYLLERPEVDEAKMALDLKAFFDDPMNAKILLLMYKYTCQTAVAQELGISQGRVRHRFFSSIDKLALSPRHKHYADLFAFVRDHGNMLHEVQKANVRAARAIF